MSPEFVRNVICQKVNWVEEKKFNKSDNINDFNTANINWISRLKSLPDPDIDILYDDPLDGAWNKVSGLYNPDKDNMSNGDYDGAMRGCIYSAIHEIITTDFNSYHCAVSPIIQSDIDFKNIAGRPLMGNWNFVYAEYGLDVQDNKRIDDQQLPVEEKDKNKLTGIEVTFYLSRN